MAININQINAVIFDMDGLLVDSEPCWQKAEQKVFKEVGIHLTHEMCLQTTGKPIADVIAYWFEKAPWPNPDFSKMKAQLLDLTAGFIKTDAGLMPGVEKMIQIAQQNNWKIGLASASPMFIIESVLKQFELEKVFDFFHSAELEKFNKPDPAVYLTVARNLGIPIENCLIMEDSGNGIKGALASGALVVAVPSAHDFDLDIFQKAHLKVGSLNELGSLLG